MTTPKLTPDEITAITKELRIRNAAPDLLAACEAVYEEFDQRYDGVSDSTVLWMGPLMYQLRQAIGKAKGETYDLSHL